MNSRLLAELANLFSIEAVKAEELDDLDEAWRLQDISDDILNQCEKHYLHGIR